jgi:hypothetical protein
MSSSLHPGSHSPKEPVYLKYTPDEKKRLHGREDIKKELGGVWMVNKSCPKQPNEK